ncbi:MAG TPA: M14 family metallopeptidase [Candidatus Polarisedimenticolia bacterium]|nr:M14 family metallopeptidase [Candidatus Polarisedimenticolia bacterium]
MRRASSIGVAATVALAAGVAVASAAPAKPTAPPKPAAAEWITRAEATGFAETPRLDETRAYLDRLAKASPWIRVTTFGKSPEGRDLLLVIAAKDGAFTPEAARRAGKAVVLLQAGIHAGEIDGKDAGMMLLRDIAITRERQALLDRVVFLFMPIYNVDGHERFGAYNRINQNGPKESGWRTTARNLNLNRDYMKADAVETRAWLRVYTTWWPDLMIDAHVTDGTDYRYDVTYAIEEGPNAPAPIRAWATDAIEGRVIPAIAKAGHQPAHYVALVDDSDPSKGIADSVATPRFSTGYTVLQNRPSFLIETHMLKDYRTRVLATYQTVVALLAEVGRDPAALASAISKASAEAAGPGKTGLRFRTGKESHPVPYAGVAYKREPSEISGAMRVIYGSAPLDITLPRFDVIETELEVERPVAYLVPPQWTDVIDILRAHGLRLERLTRATTLTVDGYRLNEPKWQEAPFEGRHPVTFKAERLRGLKRDFPAETVVVPLAQPGSAVAVHLLDPQGPDSFASWGFFDAVTEQKEFGEAYVMEAKAREMLAADPALRAEFEKALADPAFAADPRQRLDFFYRRSPYWDTAKDVVPLLRVDAF